MLYCVSIQSVRTRIEHWLRQPAGVLVFAGLLLALLVTSPVRIQVHAHAADGGHHAAHSHDVDYQDAEPASGGQSGESSLVHVHAATVTAVAAHVVGSLVPAMMMPVWAVDSEPDSSLPPDRPPELFRPPIA